MTDENPCSAGDLLYLDALGPDGDYRTRNTETVTTTAGVAVARLSLVPPLYVSRTLGAQRKAAPLPPADRRAALSRAAEVFTDGVIAGLDFEAYAGLAARISGLPVAITRAAARGVADGLAGAFDAVASARPAGAVPDWREPRVRGGGALWVRRGEVFAVHAAGNGPGVHGLWPQALALGYRVAVRPSRREPLTGHRLVTALRQAGFRPHDVVYLPTDHAGADEIIASADLAMVYGGQRVVDKYAADPAVIVNGPGRSKIVITAEQDWREGPGVVVPSVARPWGVGGVKANRRAHMRWLLYPPPRPRGEGESRVAPSALRRPPFVFRGRKRSPPAQGRLPKETPQRPPDRRRPTRGPTRTPLGGGFFRGKPRRDPPLGPDHPRVRRPPRPR